MEQSPPPRQGPRTARRLGYWFWALFWILALALASWLFGRWESQRSFPNSDPLTYSDDQRREIQLRAGRDGHYLANGTINGQPVRLLVDTGATQIAVPSGLAAQLGLTPSGTALARTANGAVRVQRTAIRQLTLGPIELHDLPATLMPDMQGPVLLGMSALKKLQFSHRNGVLTLVQLTPL